MVPELVLVTEKLGHNDDPGAMDTVVDGTLGKRVSENYRNLSEF